MSHISTVVVSPVRTTDVTIEGDDVTIVRSQPPIVISEIAVGMPGPAGGVLSTSFDWIEGLTQAQFDALVTKDPTTLYVIT
jgi:hypothetical protein